jgi:hypothetical protein
LAGSPKITICCLTGFSSPESLFLSGSPEIEYESWDLEAGRLVMEVVDDLEAESLYTVTFFALNSLKGQDSPDINITGASCERCACASC